jgi:diguanylate cyclase (GGDEF)-like protein
VESKKALISTTVSIGVAEYQLQDSHIGVVLARADKALYKAKESGKNRVVFW